MLARSLHNLAVTKMTLLDSAKHNYDTAAKEVQGMEQAKPESCKLPSDTQHEPSQHSDHEDDDAFSEISFESESSPPVTPSTRPQGLLNDLADQPSKPVSEKSYHQSPLRLRKRAASSPLKKSIKVEEDDPFQSPNLTKSVNSVTFSESTDEWLETRAMERFYIHLDDFTLMLRHHQEVLAELVEEVENAQRSRYEGQRMASKGGAEETRTLDRKRRIDRLKKCGWKMPKFDAERIQELCEKALAEL
ncbi:hypothetical protein MMC25_000056 [Agyrium rufum]|nr:hypothetical protein [Agyrium rufum]